MPVVSGGNTVDKDSILRGYEKDKMYGLAKDFLQVANAGLDEGYDIYSEPQKFINEASLRNSMEQFFLENTFDRKDPDFQDAAAVRDHDLMLSTLFKNDIQGISEAAPLGSFNPVVGITFPMHKNLLMTTVFDKGAIPKAVADTPQFTLTMETRTMYSPDGREIDMFLEQNKIKDMIERSVPHKDVVIMLPEDQETDVLGLLGVDKSKTTANISRATKVTKILVAGAYILKGEEYYDASPDAKVIKVADKGTKGDNFYKVITIEPIRFVASYGQYDRTFQKRIDLIVPTDENGEVKQHIFQFAGSMHKNKFTFMASDPQIMGVVLSAQLDVSSAAYETPKVKWSARTDFFEIPEAPHITVTVSPEETKDVQAMYNVNQLTKLLSMIKLSLLNYKDDKILESLDESFINMPSTSKVSGAFNFCPPDGYLGSHVTWRYETFMDYLDTQVTYLLQVLNDENMTVTIFGRPELIRKITPKEYTYTTPPNIGPVILDYKKTVKTSDNRIYQFISSNKLRNDNNLIIILNPRNSNRIIYKIFDYQLYVGNEIRDTQNYQLPAVTAFERFLFLQYQPVQGRIMIVNPTGLKEDIDNFAPVSKDRALNDYTANKLSYVHDKDGTGKFIEHTDELPGTQRSAMYPHQVNPGSPADEEYNKDYAYPSPNYATSDPKEKP